MRQLHVEFDEYPGEFIDLDDRSPTVDEYFAVREAFDAGDWSDRKTFVALHAALAPFIRSWSYAGVGTANVHALLATARAWIDEVRDVPPPLPRASSVTVPSPAK